MKKKLRLLYLSFLCLFSISLSYAQHEIIQKSSESRFFELKFKTASSEQSFIESAKKVEGIADAVPVSYTTDEALVKIVLKDGVKPTAGFIETFCLKTGLKEVFIDDNFVQSDMVAEALKKYGEKRDGHFKEYKSK